MNYTTKHYIGKILQGESDTKCNVPCKCLRRSSPRYVQLQTTQVLHSPSERLPNFCCVFWCASISFIDMWTQSVCVAHENFHVYETTFLAAIEPFESQIWVKFLQILIQPLLYFVFDTRKTEPIPNFAVEIVKKNDKILF